MITRQELIEQICKIIYKYYRRLGADGTKSLSMIVKDKLKLNKKFKITAEELASYLKKHDDIINNWLIYSLDKRTDKGYYFGENNGKYLIACYNKKREIVIIMESELKEIVCANFILKEFEFYK